MGGGRCVPCIGNQAHNAGDRAVAAFGFFAKHRVGADGAVARKVLIDRLALVVGGRQCGLQRPSGAACQ